MENMVLILILTAFIISAYGLNNARRKLSPDQKAKLLDAQSSPQYILGMGIIFGGLILIQYIPFPPKTAFMIWLVPAMALTVFMLVMFYRQLKKSGFPEHYLKTVVRYSFIMTFLAVMFVLVLVCY